MCCRQSEPLNALVALLSPIKFGSLILILLTQVISDRFNMGNRTVEASSVLRRQVHTTHPPVALCMNLEYPLRMLSARRNLIPFNPPTTNKWRRSTVATETPFPRTMTNSSGIPMWKLSSQVLKPIVRYDIAVGRNPTQCTMDTAAASPHRMLNRFCRNIYPGHPAEGPLRGPRVFIRIFFASHSLCSAQNSLRSDNPMAFRPPPVSPIE